MPAEKLTWEDILTNVNTRRRLATLENQEKKSESAMYYNEEVLYWIWYNSEKSLLILDLCHNRIVLKNASRTWNRIEWEEAIPETIVDTWKIYSEFGGIMQVQIANKETRLIKTQISTTWIIEAIYVQWQNNLEIQEVNWVPHIHIKQSWETMNEEQYQAYLTK